MKNLEKKIRKKVQKISGKHLNWCLATSGILALFAFFDIETLKKIELWGISDIANTIDSFDSSILDIFESSFIKALVYALFCIILLLRIYKSCMHPRAIIINHSSFSNTQSTYDSSIVSGYSIEKKDINLVNQMARHNIVDAIRTQDILIEEVLNDCDTSTELFYYGIAHIPLIFRAGFQLGDEGKVRLLHKYRNSQYNFREISSDPDTFALRFNPQTIQSTNSSTEMLVIVATSLPVSPEDLVAFRGQNICYELHFEMVDESMYGFDSVNSYATMNRLRAEIINSIRKIVVKENIQRIHLVLATSSDFTFFLAQGFSKNHDPEIVAYHYDRNSTARYPWGISNISTPTNAVVRQSFNPPTD